jgi:predicted nucleic acid-binding protein
MAVLIDTSVWVSHFRQHDDDLVQLIQMDLAFTHPMVIAELTCGTPPEPRHQTLADLGLLQQVNHVTLTEVVEFIEREKLYGLGCGLVDMVLLASTRITPGARLWTQDRRLALIAARFNVAYKLKLH